MPELDPATVLPGDVTTGAMFCARIGITPQSVWNWRTRGYLNTDGELVKVEPIPGVDDGRGTPVFWTRDLEEAEYCTRYFARDRGNEAIAADQRRHRAQRDSAVA